MRGIGGRKEKGYDIIIVSKIKEKYPKRRKKELFS